MKLKNSSWLMSFFVNDGNIPYRYSDLLSLPQQQKRRKMNITTDAEADRLAEQIKEELGVDIRVYSGEAVINQIVELSEFLQFAVVDSYKIPMFIVFILFLAAFVPVQLAGNIFWILGGIGLVLFFGLGMLLTTVRIVRRFKSTVPKIIDFTTGTVQAILVDIKQVQSVVTPENEKQKYGMLFKGVFHLVTIPMITEAIAEGIPIIGGFLKKIIKRLLLIISAQLKIDEPHSDKEPIEVPERTKRPKIEIDSKIAFFDKLGLDLKSKADFALKFIQILLIMLLVGNITTCLIYTVVIRFFQ